jgi:hypothetical protein
MDSSRGRLRNQVSVPWFDCDESLTWWGLNLNLGWFGCFTFIHCSFGELCLLVSWCAGDRCSMVCSDEEHGGSRRRCRGPGMVAQVGYSVAERSWGRMASCVVCTVHVETRSAGFLIESQNQGQRFVSGLASKPLGWFSPVWSQNWWRQFLLFDLKTGCGFLSWVSKPRWWRVSWFGPQNR